MNSAIDSICRTYYYLLYRNKTKCKENKKGNKKMDNITRRDRELPYISDESVFEEQKVTRKLP